MDTEPLPVADYPPNFNPASLIDALAPHGHGHRTPMRWNDAQRAIVALAGIFAVVIIAVLASTSIDRRSPQGEPIDCDERAPAGLFDECGLNRP